MKLKNILFYILIISFISGCTLKTAEYSVDNDISNILNEKKLNEISVSSEINNNLMESNFRLKLRGIVPIIPSTGGNYPNYIAHALKQQLSQNDLYKENSNTTIKSMLLYNNIDIWGFSIGYCTITVNFKVIKNSEIVYNKNLTISHQFPSHFVGNIAITNATVNYPIAVQKLIGKLLTDEDFLEIIKK
jgi:hypothetical protein